MGAGMNEPRTSPRDGNAAPEVHRVALRLVAGHDPWAPEGPQNPTEWDLCAAAWREVARQRQGEVERLREALDDLIGYVEPTAVGHAAVRRAREVRDA